MAPPDPRDPHRKTFDSPDTDIAVQSACARHSTSAEDQVPAHGHATSPAAGQAPAAERARGHTSDQVRSRLVHFSFLLYFLSHSVLHFLLLPISI
jgi:hypothetical protein